MWSGEKERREGGREGGREVESEGEREREGEGRRGRRGRRERGREIAMVVREDAKPRKICSRESPGCSRRQRCRQGARRSKNALRQSLD